MKTYFVRGSASIQPGATNATVLKQVLATIDAESCPRSFNFHTHTLCSDGQLHPEALIEQAVKIGLKGLAITDHHTVSGYHAAQNWLAENGWDEGYPLQLWTGLEITADLLGTEVHILGYAFEPEHPSLERYLQGKGPKGSDAKAKNAIAALHEAGGLAVLAHPARYRLPAEDLISVAAQLGIDGVETYYAYHNPNPWQPSPKQTQKVKDLSTAYGLLNTCGTDTHGLNLLVRL
jgi:hypothetical protein